MVKYTIDPNKGKNYLYGVTYYGTEPEKIYSLCLKEDDIFYPITYYATCRETFVSRIYDRMDYPLFVENLEKHGKIFIFFGKTNIRPAILQRNSERIIKVLNTLEKEAGWELSTFYPLKTVCKGLRGSVFGCSDKWLKTTFHISLLGLLLRAGFSKKIRETDFDSYEELIEIMNSFPQRNYFNSTNRCWLPLLKNTDKLFPDSPKNEWIKEIDLCIQYQKIFSNQGIAMLSKGLAADKELLSKLFEEQAMVAVA